MTDTEAKLVESLKNINNQLYSERNEMLKGMVKDFKEEEDWLKATKELLNEVDIGLVKNEDGIVEGAAISELKQLFNPNYDIIADEHIPDRYSKIIEATDQIGTILSVTGGNESYKWGGHHETFSVDDEESIKELKLELDEFKALEQREPSEDELDELNEVLSEFIQSEIIN